MKNKDWVESKLRKLDFIKWDRYYTFGTNLAFFGWIERRQDEYKDFAVIVLNHNQKRLAGYHCSSPEYSSKIGEHFGIRHSKCQRVENKFLIENKVELEKGEASE